MTDRLRGRVVGNVHGVERICIRVEGDGDYYANASEVADPNVATDEPVTFVLTTDGAAEDVRWSPEGRR